MNWTEAELDMDPSANPAEYRTMLQRVTRDQVDVMLFMADLTLRNLRLRGIKTTSMDHPGLVYYRELANRERYGSA